MKVFSWSVIALLLSATAAPAEDWIELFDGKTLNGWIQHNGYATYQVVDGTIVGRTARGSVNSFLCTTRNFGDFELQFEVKVHDKLNSGVMIRSRTKTEATGEGANNAVGRVFGPQVEIEAGGKEGAEAGYVYGEATGRGWLTPENRLVPHKKMKDGEWNRYRIVAEGPRIRTWINGQPVEDITDEEIYKTHPGGFIGLQVHRIREDAGPFDVAWRNIRLLPLN